LGWISLIELGMRFTSTYFGVTIAQPFLNYDMSDTGEIKPTPDDSRLLEVGEIIQDGDLHWNATVKHWVAVTPQGEERVGRDQHGFYSRENGDL